MIRTEMLILLYFLVFLAGFIDSIAGFRVIIMTVANSIINTRVLKLLPKFRISKINCQCIV